MRAGAAIRGAQDMAQWGIGEPDEHGLYRAYDWPEWYLEYKRIRGEQPGDGVDTLTVWRHILENWDAYVLPDLTRLYHLDTSDEEALLARPWWWLRAHLLALLGVEGSLTGATFPRKEIDDE